MGEYSHTIDAKGRVILPADFRAELGVSFIITKGLDHCLFLYAQAEWEAAAAARAPGGAGARAVLFLERAQPRVRQAGAVPRAGEPAQLCGHRAQADGRAHGHGQPHRGLEQGAVAFL